MMRFSCFALRALFPIVSLVIFVTPASSRAESPDDGVLRDDFDSKFTLNWETIRPDPTHMSLESHPGKLTITTQYGSIHQAQTTAKNLQFIKVPEELQDFVATTCVEDFMPETIWQQAGMMFYDDDDNYLKWVRDFTGRGHPVLNVNWEIAQDNKGVNAPIEVPKERFWLRVIKRGNIYQCLASLDGKTWTTYAAMPWGDGSPKKVGLVAKNGPREGDLEAQFDFFELRKPTDAELADPVFKARRALLGTWKAVERTVDGKTVTKGPETVVTIVPGTLTLQEKRKLVTSFIVDPAASPNRMTLVSRAHGVGKLLNGAYALDDDTLTFCLNPKINGEAPTTLEPKEGDGMLLLKLQRQTESK